MPSSPPERFSIRLTEAHCGARVVLKASPDGSMVRHSDLVKAAKQRDEELRGRLLSDEVVQEITKQIVEGSDGGVLSLAYVTVKDALADALASLDKEGGTGR